MSLTYQDVQYTDQQCMVKILECKFISKVGIIPYFRNEHMSNVICNEDLSWSIFINELYDYQVYVGHR